MKKGSPVIIIIVAVAIVAIMSLLPLSEWSGGQIKDFSLVSDILKEVGIIEGAPSYETTEDIDPALIQAQAEGEPVDIFPEKGEPIDTIIPEKGEPIDTIISPVKPSRVGELVKI
ncbi:hypothetical protein [uncultured Duncaniella sp.]|nr:hypothetical protein [uncultured Duncaniella sp.]